MRFEIGDIVRCKLWDSLGGKKPVPKGLAAGKTYEVIDIRRGIDGAYDWDDISLFAVVGKFCEFDFDKVSTDSKGVQS